MFYTLLRYLPLAERWYAPISSAKLSVATSAAAVEEGNFVEAAIFEPVVRRSTSQMASALYFLWERYCMLRFDK